MEFWASVLEALAISDLAYGSLVNGLGVRAKDRGGVILYTRTTDEEQALSHLTSETLRSVGEMDVFLL